MYLYLIKDNFFIKYNREYPIRTDVIFQSNKFQAYHFKPLSQFSLYFILFYKKFYLSNLSQNKYTI